MILSMFDELYASFRGWTSEGTVKGAYRMEGGRKCVEDLLKVTVILSTSGLPTLRKMIAGWAAVLGQEVMLLKVTDYHIEFVPPEDPEDKGGRR